ncbi:MAG TPA: TetR/AcrR family transcriptional regulator [Nitrospirota bacterium]|nr:TetR/AcrR family transcriptional regulator [Nitrospirota bacterium]
MTKSTAKKSATKQRLLESTLAVISEKGYLGATTREISQRAGVTELTLFRHFGTKERLFSEMLSTYTFLPRLKELLPELEHIEGEKALVLIATRFLLTLKEQKSMMKILFSEIHIYPDKIRKIYSGFIDEVRKVLAVYFVELQRKGLMRDISPEFAARTFLGMLVHYFRTEEIMRENSITKRKMEQTVADIVDIFLRGTGTDRKGELENTYEMSA